LPSSRKILILSLTRRNGRDPGNPKNIQSTVRILRLLGYKLTTASQALAAPYGRFACLTFDSADRTLLASVSPCLERLAVPATLFMATAPAPGQPTWKQLRALVASGWEIGALGHEAVHLTEHAYSEQRRLVSKARALLTQHLGAPPQLFAYPFGAYDTTTVSCVKDEGFTAAVTLRAGLNGALLEVFHLRRLPLSGHRVKDMALLMRTVLGGTAEGPPSRHTTRENPVSPPSGAAL
jgi:peptidoglycan/xylan/chitin deacetylase (PgdA/CDA1 family)